MNVYHYDLKLDAKILATRSNNILEEKSCTHFTFSFCITCIILQVLKPYGVLKWGNNSYISASHIHNVH